MRIALLNLTAGGLSGGYLKYLRSLVPLLQSHPHVRALDVFAPATVGERLQKEPWPTVAWPPDDERQGFTQLKKAIEERRPDVLFIPTARWFAAADTPVVVMVRNMEPLEVPFDGNPLRESLRNVARRIAAKRACARASRVIAVSRHVRDFLYARWKMPPEKVTVIYHGADEPMPSAAERPARLEHVASPFIFTAGSIRPARGLIDLVDAVARLKASGVETTAVVGGRVDSGMDGHYQRLNARATALGVAANIVWAGSLGDAQMRWCYEQCRAFVMTTRAEACPNVALEAMRYGCASVSVNRAPMPEFFGGAAAYYGAGDPADLAAALAKVLSDSRRSAQLAASASARASEFTWRTTAERTVAELRSVIRS